MKSIIQKGIIPARTQSQDNKFQTSRPCEVPRSGQVTTFVELSSCRVTYENCYKSSFFSIKSKMNGWI